VNVTVLSGDDVREIVSVLSDAFYDYPVMRHVIGDRERYDERLPRLVALFVNSRALRDEPMFGVRDARGDLVAAAVTTSRLAPEAPPQLVALRERIWSELGPDARARYDGYVTATSRFAVASPHHHLNMIGVRRALHGRRLGRLLLDAVHELAASDPQSSGVSLTTEWQANVALYEHCGYRVRGYARVAPDLETWTLFRPTSITIE
jgi:GNAT superfamily N-acetyltransferase